MCLKKIKNLYQGLRPLNIRIRALKKQSLRVNTIFYSTRYKCFGQCLAVADFMAYMIWANPSCLNGWYHCAELEEDPRLFK